MPNKQDTMGNPFSRAEKPILFKEKYGLIVGSLILTLILWIAGAVFVYESYTKEIEQAEQKLIHENIFAANQTDSALKHIKTALDISQEKLSKNWLDYKMDMPKIKNLLEATLATLPDLKQIALLDTNIRPIFETTTEKNIPLPDVYYIPKYFLTEPNSDLLIDQQMNTNDYVFIRALFDDYKNPIAYLYISLDKSFFYNIYQINSLDGTDHASYKINLSLYSPYRQIFTTHEKTTPHHSVEEVLKDIETPTSHIESHKNYTHLSSVRNIKTLPLVVLSETEKNDILEEWYKSTTVYVIFGIVFSISLLSAALHAQRTVHFLRRENTLRKQTELSFRMFSRAIEQSPIAVIITNKESKIEYVNPQFTEVSGYTPDEVIGKNPKILSAHTNAGADFTEMWETLSQGKVWHGEFCNRHKNGAIYWENASLSPLYNEEGILSHYIAVKEDITRRKQEVAQLELTAAVFETASEAIMIANGSSEIERVNASFSEITGYDSTEVIGKTPNLLKSGRHDVHFYQHMHTTLQASGKWQGEIWNRRKNGEIYPQWLSIKAIKNETGKIIRYISLFTDITHRKQNEERILYQANYDALTGLPNRTLFMDRLRRAIVRAERNRNTFALLFIDLDRFKNVNDTLGHAYGDLLLQKASTRLLSLVRKTDTVARLGGDEFTVILTDLESYKFVEQLSIDLVDKLSQPYHLENNVAFVSASIGITIYPNDGRTVEDLLKNADTAMYQAKENGRSLSQFFTQQMNDEANERRSLETALHQALEREEFVLHYQPIIDARTEQVISCEALLRWHQPEYGNVYPDKFIPLAEDTGLILPIGEWVLNKACQEAQNWTSKNPNAPKISVNMSSKQFQRSNVCELVKAALEKSQLDPKRLNIEITESLLIVDDNKIIQQLKEIREMGVGISIDDFGTGYSSLSYLRRFPITTLKIDRSFIKDITQNNEADALVSAILSMAQSLKLQVVAEGVETKEQFDQLRDNGCDFMQGYYYSPPIPIEAFRKIATDPAPLHPDI